MTWLASCGFEPAERQLFQPALPDALSDRRLEAPLTPPGGGAGGFQSLSLHRPDREQPSLELPGLGRNDGVTVEIRVTLLVPIHHVAVVPGVRSHRRGFVSAQTKTGSGYHVPGVAGDATTPAG